MTEMTNEGLNKIEEDNKLSLKKKFKEIKQLPLLEVMTFKQYAKQKKLLKNIFGREEIKREYEEEYLPQIKQANDSIGILNQGIFNEDLKKIRDVNKWAYNNILLPHVKKSPNYKEVEALMINILKVTKVDVLKQAIEECILNNQDINGNVEWDAQLNIYHNICEKISSTDLEVWCEISNQLEKAYKTMTSLVESYNNSLTL